MSSLKLSAARIQRAPNYIAREGKQRLRRLGGRFLQSQSCNARRLAKKLQEYGFLPPDRSDLSQVFVESVPVSLRRIVREVASMRERLDAASLSHAESQRELSLLLDQARELSLLQEHSRKLSLLLEQTDGLAKAFHAGHAELLFLLGVKELDASRSAEGGHPKPAGLHQGGGDIRINLGCGHLSLEGYINVDGRALPGVDLVAEVGALPFQEGELAEVFSAHLLEHFPRDLLISRLIPYWRSLLKPDGVFRAVVPDFDGMVRKYVRGEFPFDSLNKVTFGGQDYRGNFHYTAFSRTDLESILSAAGFRDIAWIATDRRNNECLEMEVKARK